MNENIADFGRKDKRQNYSFISPFVVKSLFEGQLDVEDVLADHGEVGLEEIKDGPPQLVAIQMTDSRVQCHCQLQLLYSFSCRSLCGW